MALDRYWPLMAKGRRVAVTGVELRELLWALTGPAIFFPLVQCLTQSCQQGLGDQLQKRVSKLRALALLHNLAGVKVEGLRLVDLQ